MKKILIIVVCGLILVSMAFFGCKTATVTTAAETTAAATEAAATEAATTQAEATEAETPLRITFVTPLFAHPVWLVAKEGFEAASEIYNVEDTWVGPQGIDVNEMINQIEIAITEEVDGIISQGLVPEAMVPVLKKAADAGIPVIITNSDVVDAPRLAFTGTDYDNFGKIAAEAFKAKFGDTPIKMAGSTYAVDAPSGILPLEATEKYLEGTPGFEWITTQANNADRMLAIQKWQEIFNTYPEVNAGICGDAESGPAAATVIKEMNLKDKVVIIGIDDTAEALDGIRDGYLFGTLTQNFYRMGYQSVQWIVEYVREGKNPASVVNDSGTTLVTIDNIDTYSTEMRNPDMWK